MQKKVDLARLIRARISFILIFLHARLICSCPRICVCWSKGGLSVPWVPIVLNKMCTTSPIGTDYWYLPQNSCTTWFLVPFWSFWCINLNKSQFHYINIHLPSSTYFSIFNCHATFPNFCGLLRVPITCGENSLKIN